MVVNVRSLKAASRRSLVGQAVACFGLSWYSPASGVCSAAKRRRTTNSHRLRTRRPMVNNTSRRSVQPDRLAGDLRRQRLPRPSKPAAICWRGAPVRPWVPNGSQLLRPRPNWGQVRGQRVNWQLHQTQRAEVKIVAGLDKRPCLQPRPFPLLSPMYSKPRWSRPRRTSAIAGMYSGSSAHLPDNTWVTKGRPKGSRLANINFRPRGRSGR